MAKIGDKGPWGGVCVDIIHTEDYGDIEIYSQNQVPYCLQDKEPMDIHNGIQEKYEYCGKEVKWE